MSIFTILNQPVAILVTASSKLIKVTNDHFIFTWTAKQEVHAPTQLTRTPKLMPLTQPHHAHHLPYTKATSKYTPY